MFKITWLPEEITMKKMPKLHVIIIFTLIEIDFLEGQIMCRLAIKLNTCLKHSIIFGADIQFPWKGNKVKRTKRWILLKKKIYIHDKTNLGEQIALEEAKSP